MTQVLQDLVQLEQIDAALDMITQGQEATQADVAPEPMNDAEILKVVEYEVRESDGDENSELARSRNQSMNYYFNRPRGDEIAGHSRVQSSDVMDVIEWMMPDIIEAFTTNDQAVQFEPVGLDDEIEAQKETAYINHIFYSEAGGYLMLYDFFKDALMMKNGIAKVFRNDDSIMRYVEYTGLSEVELEKFLAGDEDTEVEVIDQQEDVKLLVEMSKESQEHSRMLPSVQEQIKNIMEEAKMNAQYAMQDAGYDISVMNQQTQQMFMGLMKESATEALEQVTVTFYDVKAKLFIENDHSECEAIPPEEFKVNSDHNSICLDNARFTCHERPYTVTELLEMGVSQEVLDDLPTDTATENENIRIRRFGTTTQNIGTGDDATREIMVQNCYMKIDVDQDGYAELRHIMVAGNKVIENDYYDENPFVSIAPIMIPHRWIGVSVADRMKQIQDIGTATWRQLLDNMYKMNNARTLVIENKVNMDDLLSSRAGGSVRVKDTEAVKPFPHTPIGVEGYQLLQKLSQVRMERSGVGPEMMAEGMVIDNDTAHGVERLMAAKEKLLGIIIRNFAETGVSKMFLKLHNLEIKHRNKEREIRINGTWSKMSPWEWKHRSSTTIKVGLGAGDKMKHAATLENVVAKQTALIQQGMDGILVSNKNRYQALTDQVRFSGIRTAEQYFTDPDSPEAKQAIAAKQKAAQEPSIEEKILILTKKIEDQDAKLRQMKQGQQMIKDSDEQERKWAKDKDESQRGWTELEIKAGKDLGPEGRAE